MNTDKASLCWLIAHRIAFLADQVGCTVDFISQLLIEKKNLNEIEDAMKKECPHCKDMHASIRRLVFGLRILQKMANGVTTPFVIDWATITN